MTEVEKVLLKVNKIPGEDGILPGVFRGKALDNTLIEMLAILFNNVKIWRIATQTVGLHVLYAQYIN